MKGLAQRSFILAVGAAALLITGCEGNEAPSGKKSRLIAAENIRLRKELDKRGKEIDGLKDLHEKETERQEELLAKCREREEALEKQLQQSVKENVDSVLAAVVEENVKLREQISQLKVEVEKLKSQQDEATE